MGRIRSFKADKISKRYRHKEVVKSISIEFHNNEMVSILGPNGAGKTTSFRMMVGIIPVTSGRIYIDNTDITSYPLHIRARLGIGYLPQGESIFKDLTVEENLLLILEMRGIGYKESRKKVAELLDDFKISYLAKNPASSLSGGEKRRLTIARVLSTDPSFVFLDEPFAGVDPIAVQDIKEIIKGLKEKNIGLVLTDHNPREALSISDRVYMIYSGEVVDEGSPESIYNSSISKQIYFGDSN